MKTFLFCFLFAANAFGESFIDFVGNKVIITQGDEIKIIEVKQEDIEKGNVEQILKDINERLNPNKKRH